MDFSATSGAATEAQASASSGASASASSPPNSNSSSRWGKLKQLEFLRLMRDNQRTLDTTAKDNQGYRQQVAQMRGAQNGAAVDGIGATPSAAADSAATDDMGDFHASIDSPITNNYYQQPGGSPPAATPAPNGPGVLGTLGKVLLGGALTAGGVAGGYLLNKPAPTAATAPDPAAGSPAPVNTSVTNGFDLQLLPPDSTGGH